MVKTDIVLAGHPHGYRCNGPGLGWACIGLSGGR